MLAGRNKLYTILILASISGYIWLFYNYSIHTAANSSTVGVCLIKEATSIPCPSCGTTRSIISLLKGDFFDSVYWNPLGIILTAILFLTPVWISYDSFTRKDTLMRFYHKIEKILKQKKVAIPAIFLIAANWIWNIYKGL